MIENWDVSRNSLCPCNSGKKFKNCCLKKHRMKVEFSRAEEELNRLALSFSLTWADIDIEEAWNIFTYFDGSTFEMSNPENQLFFPMLISHEDYQQFDEEYDPNDFLTGLDLLIEYGDVDLSALQLEIANLKIKGYLSFYEVLRTDPGQGVLVKDVLYGGKSKYVREYSSSKVLERNNLFFGSIVKYKSDHYLVGCGAAVMNQGHKMKIIEFREKMNLPSDWPNQSVEFRTFNAELAKYYYVMIHGKKAPTTFTNTDGELLLWHEILIQVKSSSGLVSSLLNYDHLPEYQSFELDGDDNGAFPVKLIWDRTITKNSILLGRITINKDEITAGVNSVERANALKAILKDVIGEDKILNIRTTQTTTEELKQNAGESDEIDPVDEEVFQEFQQQYLENHWAEWINSEIPALDNLTPRQAADDKLGREKLITLLNSMEEEDRRLPGISQAEFIDEARRKLGLL